MSRTRMFEEKKEKLVTNAAGGKAYKMSNTEALISYVMTGSVDGSYYSSAKENVETISQLLNENNDAEFLAKLAVYSRNMGWVRTMPIATLVRVSQLDPAKFKEIYRMVLKTPKDWKQFIDIARSKKIRQGVGRSIKTAGKVTLAEMKPYYALKYASDVRDMINIVRPAEKINPHLINYLKGKENATDASGEYFSENEIGAYFANFERIKSLSTGQEQAEELLKNKRGGEYPFEAITGTMHMTDEVWGYLMKISPYMNMIRNVRNFGEKVIKGDVAQATLLANRISDINNIKKSGMFPFQFYNAWRTVNIHATMPTRAKDILTNALRSAVLTSVENLPDLDIPNGIAIMADISGSMSSVVTGSHSDTRACDLVGLFSAAFKEKYGNKVTMLPFEGVVNMSVKDDFDNATDFFKRAETLTPRGGTNMTAPIEWLLAQNMKVDYIVGFTDNESWVDEYGSFSNHTNFYSQLLEYRRRVNKDVKAYLFTLIPSGTRQTPSNEFCTYVFGWNENVLRLFGKPNGTQMKDIEAYWNEVTTKNKKVGAGEEDE